MRKIYLVLYYGFAKYLPKSTTPIVGKAAKAIRRFLCSRIFRSAGKKLNVEQGAYFGNGKDIEVGYEVGFGRNFQSRNVVLKIGDYRGKSFEKLSEIKYRIEKLACTK